MKEKKKVALFDPWKGVPSPIQGGSASIFNYERKETTEASLRPLAVSLLEEARLRYAEWFV